jgi:hypothetical protein
MYSVKTNKSGNIYKKALMISACLLIIAFMFCGCGYKTYSAEIGSIRFSFEYPNNVSVVPYFYEDGRANRDYYVLIPDYGLALDPIVYLDYHKIPGDYANAQARINAKCIELQEQFGFSPTWRCDRKSINIGDIEAVYFEYDYAGYTTRPIDYYGTFIAIKYDNLIIDIDILITPYGLSEDYQKTFNLIVDTFKIEGSID